MDPSSKIRGAAIVLALACAACGDRDTINHEVTREGASGPEIDRERLSYRDGEVQTHVGYVMTVEPFQRMERTRTGVRLVMRAADETFYVYLAPDRFLEKHGLFVESGDLIEVRGSVVAGAGHPVIIANTITKGQTTIELRDDEGRPSWRRFGKRQA